MYVATFYSFKGGVGRTMALVSPWRVLKDNDRREEVSFPLRLPEEEAA